MSRPLTLLILLLSSGSLLTAGCARTTLPPSGARDAGPGQESPGNSAQVEIVLDEGTALEQRGREQLLRLLADYDLEPWLFTRKVKIDSYVIPHSHPVLTLNTQYVDDDQFQLASFLHEQAHRFEASEERTEASDAALEVLRGMYPEVPSHEEVGTRSDRSTYIHLIINWLELDALRQLLGEERARQILAAHDHYEWVYQRVLEDTETIGDVLRDHGLVIEPDGG